MRVRIYQPTRTAMQSGRAKTHMWFVEPEMVAARMPEPLMGWTSASDTLIELQRKLSFHTLDEAIAFATKHAWEYYVDQPAERKVQPRTYLDNFRIVRPQDEERAAKAEK